MNKDLWFFLCEFFFLLWQFVTWAAYQRQGCTPNWCHKIVLCWYTWCDHLHVADWLRSEIPSSNGTRNLKTYAKKMWKNEDDMWSLIKCCFNGDGFNLHKVCLQFRNLNFVIFALSSEFMPRSGWFRGGWSGSSSIWVGVGTTNIIYDTDGTWFVILESLQNTKNIILYTNQFDNKTLDISKGSYFTSMSFY